LRLLLAAFTHIPMINLHRLALVGAELVHACTATIPVSLPKNLRRYRAQ
jgi:hypothetical protein